MMKRLRQRQPVIVSSSKNEMGTPKFVSALQQKRNLLNKKCLNLLISDMQRTCMSSKEKNMSKETKVALVILTVALFSLFYQNARFTFALRFMDNTTYSVYFEKNGRDYHYRRYYKHEIRNEVSSKRITLTRNKKLILETHYDTLSIAQDS